MRFLVLFLGLVALSKAAPLTSVGITQEFVESFKAEIDGIEDLSEISSVLNDYADKIFANIRDALIHNGLDPFEMPDIHEGFNYTLLLITYRGNLDLTRGWLNDLSTIHRGGDVVVTYTDQKSLTTVVPIAFDQLSFTYDYSATLMDLGPSGQAEGIVDDLSIQVTIGFDFENFVASLDDFSIMNTGKLDLNFKGNILVDWFLDLLVDVGSAVLHNLILTIVQNIVTDPIETVIDDINKILAGILNPTTAAPLLLS